MVVALLPISVGLFSVVLTVLAWVRPKAAIVQAIFVNAYAKESEADPLSRALGNTRERRGDSAIIVFRFIGPVIAACFLYVGGMFVASYAGCGIRGVDLRPLFGSLEFTFWPPLLIFVPVGGLFGLNAAWKVAPPYRVPIVLLAMCTALAWCEAAAYHVGPMANRWALASLVPLVETGVLVYLGRRRARPQQGRSQSPTASS